MQQLTSPPQAGDHVLPAFEACCAALRALEASAALEENQEPERQRHICSARELLDEAIAELRSVSHADSSAGAAGFVLPREPPPGNG